MKIGKTFRIDCAHFLPDHPHCGSMHGHTYIITIVCWGDMLDPRGMLVDFTDLKKIVKFFDHKCLNDLFDRPTCERFAILICKLVKQWWYWLDVTVIVQESPEGGITEVQSQELEAFFEREDQQVWFNTETRREYMKTIWGDEY